MNGTALPSEAPFNHACHFRLSKAKQIYSSVARQFSKVEVRVSDNKGGLFRGQNLDDRLNSMSTKNEPAAPENPVVKWVMFIFIIASVVGYQQAVVPWLFPGQRGFNPWQTVGAMVTGAIAGVVGALLGKMIVWIRK